MTDAAALRAQLSRFLDWEEAHVTFDRAVDRIPAGQRGSKVAGFEHTLWQLLEHMRIAQKDLLDFCRNPDYTHALAWPEDYWPQSPAPPDEAAWAKSIENIKADREALKTLVLDPAIDLLAPVPTGSAPQTHLRAILLVVDHNAYHLGQLVAVRQALGLWD